MKKILTLTFVLLLGLLSAKQYTLDDLINAGLNNATSFRQTAILLRNADLGLRNATWSMLPSASVSAGRTNTDGNYTSLGQLNFQKTLTLNDPTYFGFRQAQIDKLTAGLSLKQSKKDLVFSIYTAWLDILQLQKELDIQKENLKVLQKTQAQTEAQQSLGQRTLFDVNQSAINTYNAELSINDLQNQLANSLATLMNQVRISDSAPELSTADEVSPDTTLVFTSPSYEPINLVQLRQSLRKTELNKWQERIGLYPSLSLYGSYNYHSIQNEVFKFGNYQDTYTLSLMLSWSLWSPWTNGSAYSQLVNNMLVQQWQLQDSQATLALNKANQQRNWDYLKQSYALNVRKAAQAEENLNIAQEKYKLGTLSLIDLEQAQVDALTAHLAENSLTYQLLKAAQQWNLLTSQPLLGKY